MKDKFYYLDGSTSSEYDCSKDLHRVDGPAYEGSDGTKAWIISGKYHREDGPALEYFDGTKYWYLKDKYYTEKDYNNIIKEVNEMCLALLLTDPREWVRERATKKNERHLLLRLTLQLTDPREWVRELGRKRSKE